MFHPPPNAYFPHPYGYGYAQAPGSVQPAATGYLPAPGFAHPSGYGAAQGQAPGTGSRAAPPAPPGFPGWRPAPQ